MQNYKVRKRDGTLEPLDLDKAIKSLQWATEGIPNVSVSDIMMRAKLHLFDGISTDFIHDTFIKTCNDMSSLRFIGYDAVAKNLYLQKLYKNIFNSIKPPHIKEFIGLQENKGISYSFVNDFFNDEELDKLNSKIQHNRDFNFTYSGIQYVCENYGITKDMKPTETPQFIYMLIAMDAFKDYHTNRMFWIETLYEALSTFKVTLPSPEMRALRTNSTAYASCILLRLGDNIPSWHEVDKALVLHTVESAGCGVDIADVASVGDKVKNGLITHSGKLPIVKSIDTTIGKCSQNGRRGSATPFINFYDPELLSIMALKSPRMPAEDRINDLSYGIKVNQFVYDRAKQGKKLSLFSKRDCPKLNELFYAKDQEEFIRYYEECEQKGLAKDEVDARHFFKLFATEGTETSAYYLVNIDEANYNTTYKEAIPQSNICQEVFHPTKPLDPNSPNSPDIGVCVLGNINQGEVSLEELPLMTELMVKLQTHLAVKQNHPMPQANAFVQQYRDIGIGISNHAYFLAKNKVRYGHTKGLELHDQYMEHFAYGLINASIKLAKEVGEAPLFRSKVDIDKFLPIDRYKKTVDELVNRAYDLDWGYLRSELIKHGAANCGLSCIPPSESSSVPSNQTTSLEPIKDLLTIKDKSGVNLKQYAPKALELAQYYDFAYDRDINKDFIKHVAITQKWIDKGISMNTFYTPDNNGKVYASNIISDLFFAKYYGVKARYYQNTKVEDADDTSEQGCVGGGCSV